MPLASNHDTIAAIATAPGEAAVAIVRVSGPEAFAIADRVIVCRPPAPSRRPPGSFLVGHVIDPVGRTENTPHQPPIDEAVCLLFRAPHSFTRQDVVELQCHGGPMAARRLLRVVLEQGARPAEPGEFTRRAFLNGRIDLTAAEAIADLIRAQTLRAATVASEQLAGKLKFAISSIYDELCGVLTELEARLDFADDEMPSLTEAQWRPRLQRAADRVESLVSTWEQGRLLRQGAVVVIAGMANAGKSTLLNALLGYERAIVSPTPGTTRDSIEAGFQVDGIPIRLVDTAGYRATECRIERDGMARSDQLRREADGLIYLIDASLPYQALDGRNLAEAPAGRTLLIFNKIDQGCRVTPGDYPEFPHCFLSLTDVSLDLKEVYTNVSRILPAADTDPAGGILIGERHRDLLNRTRRSIGETVPLLNSGDAGHIPATIVLREGLEALDACLGRNAAEEVLDRIFSTFCIGK